MIITKKHYIKTRKVKKSLKILQMNDIHYNRYTLESKLKEIVQEIYKINPDFIVVCGDLFSDNSDDYKKLITFFKNIAQKYKVYLILGNHDLAGMKTCNGWENSIYESIITAISKIKNIKILYNEVVYLKEYNINIIGLGVPFKYYQKDKKPIDFINYINSNYFNINSNTFNEILCHSPEIILNKRYFKEINICKNADLIQTGHMHNGGIPDFIDKFINNNTGLISPRKSLFPKLARGEVRIGDVIGIIGGPVTMVSENMRFISFFMNKLVKIHLEEIHILKAENEKN